MDEDFDPLVPRPLDRPTAVPLDPDADLAVLDGAKIFAAPDDPADWPCWREQLTRWRDEARLRLAYDDRLYRRTDLAWTRSCFVVAQVWLWDELLYDFDRGRFTPERLLADARARFGGFDGIVLWHAYPVIGIDDRNQSHYYREVPGLRALVDDLHAAGVRVFCDYNPWDTGTGGPGPTPRSWPRWCGAWTSTGCSWTRSGRAGRSCWPGWTRLGRGWRWRGSRPCRACGGRRPAPEWTRRRSRAGSARPTARLPSTPSRAARSTSRDSSAQPGRGQQIGAPSTGCRKTNRTGCDRCPTATHQQITTTAYADHRTADTGRRQFRGASSAATLC